MSSNTSTCPSSSVADAFDDIDKMVLEVALTTTSIVTSPSLSPFVARIPFARLLPV